MFTHKDIETRTVFVINCIKHERGLRVSNGELLLEEQTDIKKKTLTKFPFQKILALFIIGHITVTTPLIEKCKKHNVALFFLAYFQGLQWSGRKPRIKSDIMNVTLDIGYTILFNFMECFIRMFGFDLYVGVYHRLWFKRKSLVCDLIEPFRCLIDHAVLLAFNRNQFVSQDFELKKSEYYLKREKVVDYYQVFYNVLINHKTEIFRYIQTYYRCFMGRRSVINYPNFIFK